MSLTRSRDAIEKATGKVEFHYLCMLVSSKTELKKNLLLDVEGITRYVIFRWELLNVTHPFINGKGAPITELFGELIFINLWIVMCKFVIKVKPMNTAQTWLIDKTDNGFTL